MAIDSNKKNKYAKAFIKNINYSIKAKKNLEF
jgi:hypothetical protein